MSKVHFVPFYYIIIYFTKQNKKRQWYVVIKGYQGIEGYEGLHMNVYIAFRKERMNYE